jgi:hypothetical protein
LDKLELTFEKVLRTIVKSFEKIVKSYNSCALVHPIVKSDDKIVICFKLANFFAAITDSYFGEKKIQN